MRIRQNILSFSALLVTICLSAQVGINTDTPQSTLDIEASNRVSPSNTDGLLIPRIDAFPTTDPTAAQNGMLIFLTQADGSSPKGFYFWDENATPSATWVRYAAEWEDGEAGGKQLIYASQARANNRQIVFTDDGFFGLGTDTPQERMEIVSDDGNGAGNARDNDIQITSTNPPNAPNIIFYTRNGTEASPSQLNDNDPIGFMSGRVWDGSGRSDQVVGVQLMADGNHAVGSLPTKIEFSTTPSTAITDIVRMTIRESGDIGINTANPTSTLDVNGDLRVRNLTAGQVSAQTNGLLFISTFPYVVSVGKVNSVGTAVNVFGATTSRVSVGRFRITFDTAMPDNDYIIQLTLPNGTNNTIHYGNQQTGRFDVYIYDDTGALLDSDFSYNVTDF